MNLLNTLLEITVYSGVIFILIMLIKKAFRNMISPFLHCFIWAVFLLRLVIPVTFDAPVHFFTQAPVTGPIYTSNNAAAPAIVERAAADTEPVAFAPSMSSSDNALSSAQPRDSVAAPVTSAIQSLTLDQIVLTIWLGGAALGLSYIALLAVLLKRKTALKSAPASAHLQNLLAEVKDELHIKANLRLLCLYESGSPALMIPRTILMPMDKLAMMDDAQIKNCLRHECMHYKRKDQLMCLFLMVLNAVYWFNPFMWLAYYEIRKDMETACDGAVVKQLVPSARRDYAELILNLSGFARHIPMVLSMAHSKKYAERRIRGVFMTQHTKRSVKFLTVTLTLVLLICCFTTACQPASSVPDIVNTNVNSVNEGHKLKDLTLPDERYTYHSQNEDESLTINVDATIVKLLADKMPVARVKPMVLSQTMATGIFNYLYPDKKPYIQYVPLTKNEIADQIDEIKTILDLGTQPGGLLSEDQLASYTEQLNKLEDQYAAAPDTKPELMVSDGTMFKCVTSDTDKIIEADGKVHESVDKELSFLDVSLDGDHLMLSSFENAENPDTMIWYTKPTAFSTNAMIPISDDFDTPNAAQKELKPSYKAAKDKADAFFSAVGINDAVLFAAYYVEGSSKSASNYFFKLIYTRTVNGVPVGCHLSGSASGQDPYTEPWSYESISFLISSQGILDMRWDSPCTVTQVLNDDADLIDFDTAVDKFEAAVSQTYDKYVNLHGIKSSIDVNIDSVQLNLVRMREKTADGTLTGLYVPAYVFYGYVKEKVIFKSGTVSEGYMTSVSGGTNAYPGPLMVMAVNAIDGTIINTMEDIY